MQSNIFCFLGFAIVAAVFIRNVPGKVKSILLLFSSCLFYLICDYRFFALALVQVVFSYYISKTIRGNNLSLVIGILICSASLIAIKILGFMHTNILLPLGISYYTFKILSYLIDSYFDRIKKYSFLSYANYVLFFPQIICGPIARAPKLMEQLDSWDISKKSDIEENVYLIISGLFKKIVIADRLADYVTRVFDNYSGYPALALWMGAFFYTIELYCDFAGYSEIVIGVAGIMGIETDKNFNVPYLSYSITDFWRNWHISLSSWLKDYIYIPLGGNRKGRTRRKINVIITFFVSGIWHGNGVNYIVWGIYHGLLNLVPIKKSSKILGIIMQSIGTFFGVCIGWIIFRSVSVGDGVNYILLMVKGLFDGFLSVKNITASVLPFTNDNSCVAYMLTVVLMIVILFVNELLEKNNKKRNIYITVSVYVMCILLFGVVGEGSFLYANY